MMSPDQFLFLQQQLWQIFGPVMPWIIVAFLVLNIWLVFLMILLVVINELALIKF